MPIWNDTNQHLSLAVRERLSIGHFRSAVIPLRRDSLLSHPVPLMIADVQQRNVGLAQREQRSGSPPYEQKAHSCWSSGEWAINLS
jgi:hypothetical protein